MLVQRRTVKQILTIILTIAKTCTICARGPWNMASHSLFGARLAYSPTDRLDSGLWTEFVTFRHVCGPPGLQRLSQVLARINGARRSDRTSGNNVGDSYQPGPLAYPCACMQPMLQQYIQTTELSFDGLKNGCLCMQAACASLQCSVMQHMKSCMNVFQLFNRLVMHIIGIQEALIRLH